MISYRFLFVVVNSNNNFHVYYVGIFHGVDKKSRDSNESMKEHNLLFSGNKSNGKFIKQLEECEKAMKQETSFVIHAIKIK